ncbi:MAG: hypothetical protein LBB47_07220 [Spirochaetaceae bacterium]|nr:hypothetical protein [Spirochaetaceae bacterium]
MKGFQNHDFGSLLSLLPALLLLSLTSCQYSQTRETLPYRIPGARSRRIIEILDYQGRTSGKKPADWVSMYINGGVPALEKLDEFAPYFVFIAEQSSPNLNTLLRWANNFSLDRDIPQLVLLRAYRRLTENLSVSPDDMYGDFFEMFIKRLASRRWSLSQKYDETWVFVRRLPSLPPPEVSGPDTSDSGAEEQALPEEPVDGPFDSRLYMYLILNVIEKNEVESSMRLVMNEIKLDEKPSRDQTQAVNSIKSNFFNGF